jgi:hypothetical protein
VGGTEVAIGGSRFLRYPQWRRGAEACLAPEGKEKDFS